MYRSYYVPNGHNTWMGFARTGRPVAIEGSGIAAECCARLLQGAGIPFSRQGFPRPALPAILIGASTQRLFEDSFQIPGLLQGFHAIQRRVVAWGTTAPCVLPHSAVVAIESELLRRLHTDSASVNDPREASWTIIASQRERLPARVHAFGGRLAFSTLVRLRPQSDAFSCWTESVSNGWLFLIAAGPCQGFLTAVGDSPDALLGESRLVSEQIDAFEDDPKCYPAHPRITWPLSGPNWLACGSAAMSMDPLCGDGSGYAIREAILAAAVIRAAENGEPPEQLCEHYHRRLLAGFQKHLETVHAFYQSGGKTAWWTEQTDAAARGAAWCQAELNKLPPFRYSLRGFDLQKLR